MKGGFRGVSMVILRENKVIMKGHTVTLDHVLSLMELFC